MSALLRPPASQTSGRPWIISESTTCRDPLELPPCPHPAGISLLWNMRGCVKSVAGRQGGCFFGSTSWLYVAHRAQLAARHQGRIQRPGQAAFCELRCARLWPARASQGRPSPAIPFGSDGVGGRVRCACGSAPRPFGEPPRERSWGPRAARGEQESDPGRSSGAHACCLWIVARSSALLPASNQTYVDRVNGGPGRRLLCRSSHAFWGFDPCPTPSMIGLQ